jgi:hypothetical protein
VLIKNVMDARCVIRLVGSINDLLSLLKELIVVMIFHFVLPLHLYISLPSSPIAYSHGIPSLNLCFMKIEPLIGRISDPSQWNSQRSDE